MNKNQLVEEACRIHIDNAKELGLFAEGFIGRSEIRILLWLGKQDSACAVDIMNFFGLSAGRVSNLLKALEKKGYIARKQIDNDRRRVNITLTDSGKTLAKELDENLHRVFSSFFDVLGEEEALNFLSFEKKLLKMVSDGQLVLTPPKKI